MKKALVIFLIFIIFICLYFLQVNVFNKYTIAGIKPNIIIIFALFLGLFLNKFYTPIICAIMGLIVDFTSSSIIGVNAIMMVIAATSGMIFTKDFSKDSRITIMCISMVVTLVCEIISYILRIIVERVGLNILAFLEIIAIEILYNILLIIIFYPLIIKFGEWIEKVFTEDKILTRYF